MKQVFATFGIMLAIVFIGLGIYATHFKSNSLTNEPPAEVKSEPFLEAKLLDIDFEIDEVTLTPGSIYRQPEPFAHSIVCGDNSVTFKIITEFTEQIYINDKPAPHKPEYAAAVYMKIHRCMAKAYFERDAK